MKIGNHNLLASLASLASLAFSFISFISFALLAFLLATSYQSLAPGVASAAVTASKTPVNRLTSGLVGYWTFDGGDTNWVANTTADKSRSGNLP